MADYTTEQYREASQGYVGPSKVTTQVVNNEKAISGFTTYELTAEIERRKEPKKKEFIELVRELFELGYDYETIEDIMSEV
ncbi:hypothetical protein COJ25_17210 [Bacillus cereus]|nr:hypothetical protein COJ25_17210 [Bacillus cereus]